MTAETDPHGRDPHQPGAKLDAGKNRVGLLMNGFPNALLSVAEVATSGAAKYTDHGWRCVPDGQHRYTDAMYRHLLAEASGEQRDPDTHLLHAAHAAWNALARLELLLTEDRDLRNIQAQQQHDMAGDPAADCSRMLEAWAGTIPNLMPALQALAGKQVLP